MGAARPARICAPTTGSQEIRPDRTVVPLLCAHQNSRRPQHDARTGDCWRLFAFPLVQTGFGWLVAKIIRGVPTGMRRTRIVIAA